MYYIHDYIEMIHGNAFPAAPVARQLFYRDDLNIWYIYDGTAWVDLMAAAMIIHGNAWHAPAFATVADLLAHIAVTGAPIHGSSVLAAINTLIHRDATGRAQIVDPAVAADIDNLGARDAAVVLALGLHAALDTGVHGVGGSTVDSVADRDAAILVETLARALADFMHAAITTPPIHGSTVAANINTLIHRDAAGRAQIVDPAVAADIDNLGARIAAIVAHAALPTVHVGVIPSFSVHQNGVGQILPTGVGTKLTWAVADFDTEGDFDLVNERFIPSVPGKYVLIGGCGFDGLADGNEAILYAYKNGGVANCLARQIIGAASSPNTTGACLVEANGTTDRFELYGFHNFGFNRLTRGAKHWTFFQGFRIVE